MFKATLLECIEKYIPLLWPSHLVFRCRKSFFASKLSSMRTDFLIPIQSHLQNYHTQITFSTKTFLPLLVTSEASSNCYTTA